MTIVPFEGEAGKDSGVVVVHRLGPAEVMAFGPAGTLDLFGSTEDRVDRPFVDAIRIAVASAPQLQGAVDMFTGRVLRLTAEGAHLLRGNESMSTTVITGVVRSPETGRIAGNLTFVDPQSLAGLASSLPSIVGGAAMQIQLARIERALDGIKQDLAYLIRSEHLKVEAGIEANLTILGDVYSTARGRQSVEDDQWDRIANIEQSVRSLALETAKHLRTLEEALGGASLPLPARVARLNRALDDDRTLVWLRAYVHAEIAQTRWDYLYLLRQVQSHPQELESLVADIRRRVDDRRRALAALSQRIVRYLSVAELVTIWMDRIRIVRRAKLRSLLRELDEVLAVLPPGLMTSSELGRLPIPLGDGTPDRKALTGIAAARKVLERTTAPLVDVFGNLRDRVMAQRQSVPVPAAGEDALPLE